MYVRLQHLCLGSVALLFVFGTAPSPAEEPIDLEHRRTFLRETIAQADAISDQKIRAAAQWKMVGALLQVDLPDEAFDQAMKLSKTNPHTCILSLSRIAAEATKRNDEAFALRSLTAAIKVNQQAKSDYTIYVIKMCFKIDRPLAEAVAVAQGVGANRQARAFGEIRDELARRGRVDEAYQIAHTHLSSQGDLHHHRQIGYSCASVKHYDYDAKHDYFGQTISVIDKMPAGKERDFVISQLVANLLYAVGDDVLSEEHVALAEKWAAEIDEDGMRGQARQKILRHRSINANVPELERMIEQSELREEKTTLLGIAFQKLLAEGRLEEADKLLAQKLQAIKDQPRPESLSAFGRFNDDDAIRVANWMHEKGMVGALIKAGKTAEAKARIDAMKNLPDAPPTMFIGNLVSIRQALLLELEDYDALKALYAEQEPANPDQFPLAMAMHLLRKNQLPEAMQYMEPFLKRPAAEVLPPKTTNYFSVTIHKDFGVALVEADRIPDALRFMKQIPEHEQVVHAFEAFGRAIVELKKRDELEKWLKQLPHQTARVYARLGAFFAMGKAGND